MIDLKPCPFCGESPRVQKDAVTVTIDCPAEHNRTAYVYDDDEDEAARLWNDRGTLSYVNSRLHLSHN